MSKLSARTWDLVTQGIANASGGNQNFVVNQVVSLRKTFAADLMHEWPRVCYACGHPFRPYTRIRLATVKVALTYSNGHTTPDRAYEIPLCVNGSQCEARLLAKKLQQAVSNG